MKYILSFFRAWYIPFSILLVILSSAKASDMKFRYLTMEDGLSQSPAEVVFQDKDGFIWIGGTESGLNRFDGKKVKVFKPNMDNDNSISHHFVKCIAQDHNGDLWIGTSGGGLNCFSIKKETFTHYQSDLYYEHGLPVDNINDLLVDAQNTLWVATDEGLFYLSSVMGKFLKFRRKDKRALTNAPVLSLTEDDHGNLWIVSSEKLYKYNIISADLRTALDASEQPIFSRIVDTELSPNQDLWIGTDAGLLNMKSNLVNVNNFHFDYIPLFNNNKLITKISCLLASNNRKDTNLFIGTRGNGLIKYDTKTGDCQINTANSLEGRNLINDYISSMIFDKNGLLWVGTEGGICIYSDLVNVFDTYNKLPYNKEDICLRNIHGIFKDKKGILWLCSKGTGLMKIDEKNKTSKQYLVSNTNGQLGSNNIRNIYQDYRNNYWIAYDDYGLAFIEGPDFDISKIKTFQNETDISTTLRGGLIYEIVETQDSILWFTSNNGLHCYDYVSNKFKTYNQNPKDPNSINSKSVYTMFEDDDQRLWLGTTNGGLCEFNREKEYFKAYKNKPRNITTISANSLTSINQTKDGDLWITTIGGGLNRFNRETGAFIRITEKDGLASNICYSAVPDNSGNLWVSSNKGLSCININDDLSIINYNKRDGLQSNEFNGAAAFIDDECLMYFGGNLGYNSFNPLEIKPNISKPRIVFTDFKLFNRSVNIQVNDDEAGLLTSAMHITEDVELKYDQNQISFSFAALDYTAPEKNRYSYTLEGFMESWIDLGKKTSVSFTNLNPGKYILKVKGANNFGEWCDEPAIIRIKVLPPLWKQWWAYLFYFSFIFILLRLLVHNSNSRIELVNNLEIEKIKSEQSLKINDFKLEFFTSISHELRTPLSLIIGPLDTLMSEGRFSFQEMNKLQGMKRNAIYLLEILENLMTFRRLEKGKMKLRINNSDLVSTLDTCFSSFQSVAHMRSIDYRNNIPRASMSVWFDTEKIEMVMYNLISNAFKYSSDNTKIFVKLDLLDSSKQVIAPENYPDYLSKAGILARIQVIDNGYGIKKDKIRYIFKRFERFNETDKDSYLTSAGLGLAIVSDIVNLHNGDIKVDSEENRGSTFTVTIPITKEAFDTSCISDEGIKHAHLPSIDQEYSPEIETKQSIPIDTESEAVLKQEKNNAYKLLIIEDNDELRRFLTQSFEKDYRVTTAVNGVEGIKKALADTPDIVITDILMPEGVTGIEVCKTLRSEIPKYIPIIILSAVTNEASRFDGFDIGADAYITKPFSIRMLQMRVSKLLASRKKLQNYYLSSDIVPEATKDISSTDERFLHKLVTIIEANISNNEFSVSELADKVAVSRSHLYRKLKAMTGQNPVDFLKVIRLEHAAKLLAKKKYTVFEISCYVGFNDPKYFSRCFRQHFKMSPTQYSITKKRENQEEIEGK